MVYRGQEFDQVMQRKNRDGLSVIFPFCGEKEWYRGLGDLSVALGYDEVASYIWDLPTGGGHRRLMAYSEQERRNGERTDESHARSTGSG